MERIKIFAFIFLACVPAASVYSQTVTVIGGNESAQTCYDNARFSDTPGTLSRSMLEPCDYALEYVTLNLRDKVATLTNRGILRYKLQDFDAAMADFEIARNMRPEMAEIYINRGNVLYMMSEYDDAIDDYLQALNLGIGQDYAAYVNLGMSYERLGNFSLAREHYETALTLRPDWEIAQGLLNNLATRISEQNP